MAITHLKIEGFRSLKSIEWSPARLNVLIGPNGSGKSNLLRALQLLQRAANGKLNDAVLSSGGMGSLAWDSRVRDIFWRVSLEDRQIYELTLERIGTSAEYAISHEALRGPHEGFTRRPGRVILHDPFSEFALRSENETALYQLINDEAIRAIGERIGGIAVFHDLDVRQGSALRQAAIARREATLAPDGQNLVPVLHTLYTTDRRFKETLNDAMQTAFGREFEELIFPPAADQRIDMRIRWRSLHAEQSTANLSDGTLRFLMLIAILGAPGTGELIAIDEPELGLHPHMLPIIAELARQVSERTQVIFTTHSPQFLDAFAEPPVTTVVTLENGESKLETLSGKELAVWLERYTLGELFRSGELEAMV
ncbi:MAG TPA: AAA family ATPase [Thermoanaerobaculia bacterium]